MAAASFVGSSPRAISRPASPGPLPPAPSAIAQHFGQLGVTAGGVSNLARHFGGTTMGAVAVGATAGDQSYASGLARARHGSGAKFA